MSVGVANDENVIMMREPRETWKANLFWGLLFGLLLIIPVFFAPEDTPVWKKYGSMLIGTAWIGFMSRKAFQNHGRTVRCDDTELEVLHPSGSWRIPLSEVKKVTRSDRCARDAAQVGVPRLFTVQDETAGHHAFNGDLHAE